MYRSNYTCDCSHITNLTGADPGFQKRGEGGGLLINIHENGGGGLGNAFYYILYITYCLAVCLLAVLQLYYEFQTSLLRNNS